jgi:hypothetical protein
MEPIMSRRSTASLSRIVLACAVAAQAGSPALADDRGSAVLDPVHELVASLEGDFSGLPEQDDPRFGHSVALRGDTLVVGAPGTLTGSSGNIFARGAVFIYRRNESGLGWSLHQRIAFGTGGDGQCGHTVALSDNFLMVGCPWHQVSGNARGRAVIYNRDGATGNYVDAINLVGTTNGDTCGYSVAIIDGAPGTDSPLPMAAMGCPGRTFPLGGGLGANTGAVEVFRWLLAWDQAATLAPPAIAANNDSRYGHSLLFNRAGPSPGMTLLLGVGIPGKDRVEMRAMGATVMDWPVERTIDGPANSRFGHSIHMHTGRLVIGAPERLVPNPTLMPPTATPSGSITIMSRSCTIVGGCGWSQNADEILAIPTAPVVVSQNRMGHAVHALTPNRVVAGAPHFPYSTYFGQVIHYLLDAGAWIRHSDEPFDPLAASFPTSQAGYALAGDEAWLAVGLPGEPTGFGRVNVYGWDLNDAIFADDFECHGPAPGCIL